ncbi:hypothetical protein H8356DRAFT_1350334 [Neocallimastix lanati (nom. inval.)]|nr:hypothetical protein H8356DRAFT_1350334 [Neocallimastix sp. JGI-2020a]
MKLLFALILTTLIDSMVGNFDSNAKLEHTTEGIFHLIGNNGNCIGLNNCSKRNKLLDINYTEEVLKREEITSCNKIIHRITNRANNNNKTSYLKIMYNSEPTILYLIAFYILLYSRMVNVITSVSAEVLMVGTIKKIMKIYHFNSIYNSIYMKVRKFLVCETFVTNAYIFYQFSKDNNENKYYTFNKRNFPFEKYNIQ